MASLYLLLIPNVIGFVFMLLDMIADVAFLVHLNKQGIKLFYVVLVLFIFATLFINVLASIGIEEFGDELTAPDMRHLRVPIVPRKDFKFRIIYLVLGLFGLLPLSLLCLCFLVVKKNEKFGNEASSLKLRLLLKEDGAFAAVKEIQSVLESGVMIYFKCFYIFLSAILYTKNWPLLFGLAINFLSFFYGLRNDYVTVSKWKPLGFLIAIVNIGLRMTILLVLAEATKPWIFFSVLATSVLLIFFWGLWLFYDGPVYPPKLAKLTKESKPKSFVETCMSSIMYTFFLVPIDLHTAISIIPFACSSVACAIISKTPLTLRILLPFAGTLGQIPPVFWWKLFKISDQ